MLNISLSKKCSKCKVEKPVTDFNKHKRMVDGLRSDCKACKREYYLANKDRYLVWSKDWWKAHPEKLKAKEKRRQPKKNKQSNIYAINRRKVDLEYKIKTNLRKRISKMIKMGTKGGSSIRDLGCSVSELKIYLESKFQSGMSWQNYGLHGWHIDHIFPLSRVDLSNPEQFKKVVHYSNLQPLWATDNLRKGNKI